jgi:hypothetical protein
MRRTAIILSLCAAINLVPAVLLSVEPPRSVCGAVALMTKLDRYLAAGDYRRALELAQREVDETASAASYIHLTYVYHAIDAYLAYLSQGENWTAVEHLYLNLAYRDSEDLVDPPGGLARMAKEMIQTSVRQQSDVSSAMAARLDKTESDRLWMEQAGWRRTNEKTWWQGVPSSWRE